MASRAIVGQVLGHYRILEPLGAGGMGEVYRARDTQLERDVAIKILPAATFADAPAKARLLREARTASQLNHPNICTIYEVGEAVGQAFIAMELVAGQPLSTKLRHGPLTTDPALRYGLQLAEALAHAHQNKVVHRDLKSANVMITPEGRVKVLDFGLAKRIAEESPEAATQSQLSLTQPGAILGTLGYMAPEQLRGHAADARSDVWALGVILYEMGAATLPFCGETGFEISSAILQKSPTPLPSTVTVELRAVIERCLEKEPARRYQTAGEVRAALEAIQTGTVSKFGLARYYFSRRRWLVWTVAALAMLLLVAALTIPWLRMRLAPGLQIRSVAVLPLENLSGNPEQDYFADGVHEGLINNLAKLSGLRRVTARLSVMRFRKSDKALSEIGRQLGVDAVITGSVQRAGDRVRVTAHLINATNEEQLWTEQYDRPMRDVLSLEDEIVGAITRQIKLKLTSEEKTRFATARTVNPEAYDAYLKGLSALHRRSLKDLEIALQYFERAVEKDPNYAPAYAGIAQVAGHRQVIGILPPSATEQGRVAARKALQLDESSSEAHAVWGLIHSVHAAEWKAAEKEFRRAIELSPNDPDPHQYYSGFLEGQGRFQEAEAEVKKAVELDPLSSMAHGAYGMRLRVNHRYDEAIAEWQKALGLNPSAPVMHHNLAITYHLKGMDQQAFAEAKAQAVEIEHDAETAAALDGGYAQGGFREAMRRAAEIRVARSRRMYVPPSRIAELYALAGDKDRVLAWLRKSLDQHELTAMNLRVPVWDFLRFDPGFQEIFQRRMKPQQ